MWNLDGPVELLDFDEQLQVARQGRQAGADVLYQDGLPTAAHPPQLFTIVATWQPMGGKDLLLLPESFREHESAWLWQPHYEGEQAPLTADIGDVVLRLGKTYQVQGAENWGSYSRCMCVRIDVGQAAFLTEPPALYPPAD